MSLVAGAYAFGLMVDDAPVDLRAPLYGAALLVACELTIWSCSLTASARGEPGMLARHAAWLGLLALGALVLGAGLLALVDVAQTGGVVVDTLGVAAAFAAIAMLLGATRASDPQAEPDAR